MTWFGILAAMSPEQKKLLPFAPPPSGITIVNDCVLFRTEGTRRVISVHGVVLAHYDVTDHAAEAYAMISLFESGYADQNDIARCFGCSARTLRRYQQRVEVDGLLGLAGPRGRPPVNPSDRTEVRKVDRTILHFKAQGFSNRVVAGRIGVDERTIRRHLRRLAWVEPSSESLLFPVRSRKSDVPQLRRSSRIGVGKEVLFHPTAMERDLVSQQRLSTMLVSQHWQLRGELSPVRTACCNALPGAISEWVGQAACCR